MKIRFEAIDQKANSEENFGRFREALNFQILNFREYVKEHLFRILYAEILILIGLLFLQGFHLSSFNLNNWAFGFFINGCLIQTFFLIKYIVHHLFPAKNSSLE